MDEVNTLISDLVGAGDSDWARSALVLLRRSPARFAGRASEPTSDSLPKLVRIYELRLNHCRERNIPVVGIEALVDALHSLKEPNRVHIKPFVGEMYTLAAFYDSEGKLIGCLTFEGAERDRGLRNLQNAVEGS